jgi:LPS-assembly protein
MRHTKSAYKKFLHIALLLSMFSHSGYAQELGLKMQSELLPPRQAADESPLFIDADRIRGRQDREIEATGNVRLRRTGEAIFADHLRYVFAEREVTASGNLRFERDGVVVTGQGLRYNLSDSTGEMDEVEYFLLEAGARGEASRLIARDRNTARVENATYTNCEVGNDDWYMRARTIDLDRMRDLGIARNASVVFKGVPILYSPYLDFSLSGSRKSGFLPPAIGQTAQTGTELTVPYYFNLAPNYDATLSPRYMSRRGAQLGGELRYLEKHLSGDVRAQYMENDREREDSRYAYALRHNQRFGERTTGYINVLGVSDDFYFTDLSNQIAATSLTNLPREAGVDYNGDWWNLAARVQDFQTLQDPLAPVTPPYARLPQITLTGGRPTPVGLDVNLQGELVDFEHPYLVSARRDTLYPSISLPLRNSFLYVTPNIGYHYTRYTYDDDSQPNKTRELPIFSLDSGIVMERDTSMFGRKVTQTLEPRLYYVYIPYVDQDDIPIFDTAESDFNLAQIFTWNQFSGGDRINDADQLTGALTSRLIDPRTGNERMRFVIGQRYYFSDQRVTLNSPPRDANRTDLLLGAGGTVTAAWKFDSLFQYGTVDNQFERSNIALQYGPEPGKVANIAYRFTREQQEQVDLSAQWPLTSKWSGLARWNYSLESDKILEGLIGLEYNAGCWTTRLVAHHFVTSVDDYSSSFFLQLELNGVSSLGLNPLDTLRSNIRGYTKSN